MKTIYLLIGCVVWMNFGFLSNKTKVKITNQSEVIIKGKSNLNTFECKYNSVFIEDEIHVSLVKQNSKIILDGAKIAIKSTGFDCAHKIITKDFKSLIKANEYADIKLEVKEINTLKETLFAKVKVDIAGISNEYCVPVQFDAKTNNVKGQLKINIKEYHLKAPNKLLGMVKVNDQVDINFNLFLLY
jgi:hypothetical protein